LAAATTQKLDAASVLNIDPSVSSVPRAQTAALKISLSADIQQLLDKKDLPGLYQRAKNGAQTGEAQYIQAALLERCAKRAPSGDGKKPVRSREERRQEFQQSLTGTDAQKAARLAAYDALNVDACGELKSIEYSKDEVARLRKAAADAGDARARAWQLNLDITKASEEDYMVRHNIKPDDKGPRGISGYLVSDEQWAVARELLAKSDPVVIGELRDILASSLTDASLRFGPDKEPIDNRAFWNALTLAACDLGDNCGPENTQLQAACAYRNRCGSASVQDHTYFYDSSPHDAQLVERYRQSLLGMMQSGDVRALDLLRGPRDARSTFVFSSRRG
jgi:hypothetical protein